MQTDRTEADRLFRVFAKSGDPRALGEVYDLVAPELLRVALHATREAAEAEDVLQATFVAAIERASSFDPEQRVLPWLMGILAHEARKARARAARSPDPERLARDPVADPALDAERAELLRELDSALGAVPEAFRPVLQLRLRHGLSVTEIAAALSRPSGTVRSQLARGSECLRRSLPVGLAGALVLATPTRGIAAVRAAVVRHATLAQGSISASTLLGGMLAVKKLAVVAALVVSALVLWNARDAERETAAESVALAAGALGHPPEPALEHEPDAVAEAVTPAAARVAVPEEPATVLRAVAPGARLLVHARWPDGAPAAGELVLVTTAGARPDDALALPTDEHGTARFAGLEPGPAQVRLLRGRENDAQLEDAREAEVFLEIVAGVSVEGRVVDGLGEPVPGAEIWLSERYRNNLGHVVARCDERGSFVLRDVGPDHYLGARCRGFAPSGLRSVRGTIGDRLPLVLRLEHDGVALRGRVVDEHGDPVPGALVLLGEEEPASVRLEDGSFAPAAPPQRARAGDEGRFELESAPLGPQPLQVRASGFAPLRSSLEVFAGAPNECRLTLVREARVVGRVRGPDGRPIAGAWVYTDPPERFASSGAWSGLDGGFELAGLGGERIVLVAQNEEHGRAERELDLAPGETREWEATLGHGPRITGQVLDEHGSPLAGAVVVALDPGNPEQRVRSNTTDGEGSFAITGIAEQAYRMWVQPPLGWRDFPLLEVAEAWPGDAPLVLRVPASAERGRITAQVCGPDGAPLAGAELQVWHVEERQWRSFVSQAADGAITVEDVPAGRVELELRHPEHPWLHLGEKQVTAGATLELGRLELAAAGSLRARLTGLAESDYAALTAMLADASNRESGVARITPGSLTAGALAPGEHVLVLGGDGVRQVRRTFSIRAGVETTFDLVLERCGMREVVLELPPDSARPRWLHGSLFAADGSLVWGGGADLGRETPVLRVSAPAGSYRLRVGGEGLSGDAELVIGGTAGPPLALRLARQP